MRQSRGAERRVLASESMPLWGTEADMHELMRRHEAEGMGAFKPDNSEFGRLFVETALPGGERWAAPCGCSVTIPAQGDPVGRPTFHPAEDHLEWAEPTDREQEVLALIRAPMPRRSRRRRLFRRG